MQTQPSLFSETQRRDIHALADAIQRHIDDQWEAVFQQTRQKMVDLYAKIGDSAYGLYGQRLFQPIHEQFKEAGLRATPKLPGSLMISREWGVDETDRQRWMWSKITDASGKAVGTIAIVFYHDHEQIRIPRAFRAIAVEPTSRGAVVAALSRLSADFRDALDMKEEIARYMASMADAS